MPSSPSTQDSPKVPEAVRDEIAAQLGVSPGGVDWAIEKATPHLFSALLSDGAQARACEAAFVPPISNERRADMRAAFQVATSHWMPFSSTTLPSR